jgi:hypothetical protein
MGPALWRKGVAGVSADAAASLFSPHRLSERFRVPRRKTQQAGRHPRRPATQPGYTDLKLFVPMQ